jgi:putative hydrolase of the HAD superfamily
MPKKITTLFCDLGGVLLTNGWDHNSRKKAAEIFGYDFDEAETRHRLLFGDYEIGEISLDEYLHYVIFNVPRKFTPQEYKDFMYKQSKPLEGMLPLIKELREKQGLKIVIVSNEGRDLTDYRIKTFGLKEYVDIFIVSCFAGVKKPDKGIFRLAMDVAQVSPENVLYLEDRELFVELAKDLGIQGIRHTDLASTKKKLSEYV